MRVLPHMRLECAQLGGEIMWNVPTSEQLEKLPKIYETEETPLQDKTIYLHFFIGGSDWYIAEYDGEDLFWGFAILNGDYEMAEWGYISFAELKSIKVGGWLEIDNDLYWKVRKASEVEKIRKGNNGEENHGRRTVGTAQASSHG